MILCKCGCGEEIVQKLWHKYSGIPKFIRGHQNRINHPMLGKKGKNNPNYGRKNSLETIELMSKIKFGENNPMYGKVSSRKGKTDIYSKETLELMRLAKLGKKLHLGYKNSNKSILKMSKSALGKHIGRNNGRFGKPPKHGKRYYYNSPLQGKVCFRSSWELKYTKYLDENKILWMYEMETFDLGDTTYTPDFFLPQFEKFIEIKGWMRERDQMKINKFLEQYPWDLEILYKEDLIKLGCEL